MKVWDMVFHPTMGYGKVIFVREGFPKIKVRFGSEEVKLDRDEVSMAPSVANGVSELQMPKKMPVRKAKKPVDRKPDPADPVIADLFKMAEVNE